MLVHTDPRGTFNSLQLNMSVGTFKYFVSCECLNGATSESFLPREFAPLYVLQVLTSSNSTYDAGRTMKFAIIIELLLLLCYWT